MTIHTTKVTRKGQITIPVGIRDALGIHEGDVLVVEQETNVVTLRRTKDVVDWTAGALAEYAKGKHLSPREIRETAAQAIADQGVSELDS